MTQTGVEATVQYFVRKTCTAVRITLLHLKFIDGFFSACLLYIYVLENPLKLYVLLLEV